jgi:hypothetical protein
VCYIFETSVSYAREVVINDNIYHSGKHKINGIINVIAIIAIIIIIQMIALLSLVLFKLPCFVFSFFCLLMFTL